MKHKHMYRNIAYLIITFGVALALVTSVLPHYNQSHRLAIDMFLLGILPYAIYSLFTVLSMRLLLIASGFIIVGLDLFIKLPNWWEMQTREIADALYSIPIISTCIVLPITLLIHWLGRSGNQTATTNQTTNQQ